MEKELGIDLQQDLLKPLGDVWCVYNSPGEGGLLVTGLTGVVQVKDHDRLQATLDKLMALFHDRVERRPARDESNVPSYARGRTPRIVKTAFAGQVIYHFDIPDGGFPLAPAWCLTEKELVVSTFPQNIKSYLSRGKDFQSLATVPDVAEALEGGAVALNYCDTRKLAEFAYPLLVHRRQVHFLGTEPGRDSAGCLAGALGRGDLSPFALQHRRGAADLGRNRGRKPRAAGRHRRRTLVAGVRVPLVRLSGRGEPDACRTSHCRLR